MKLVQKGLLIFPILKDLNRADGILVKNQGVEKGFLENGIDVDTLEFNSTGIFNGEEQVYRFQQYRYQRIYQHSYSIWKVLAEYVISRQYDFMWMRVSILTSAVARFISAVKKHAPSCQIILEYGAYPFVKELPKIKQAFYYLNLHNEKKGHRNADFVITYCGQDKVDNLVNIPINNGIDIAPIPVVRNQPSFSDGINFIGVSSLKKWHAYERIIEGIALYVKQPDARQIHFHVVGNGPEYEKLATIVKNNSLGESVIFHHFKTGKELDAIYNISHVAIGTLGFHRIGITNSSSLKNREYFARGLPIVVSTPDKDMPSDLPYVLYVPEGEEPININNVVQFAKKVYAMDNLSQTIRNYAEDNVTWRGKIKTVLKYLNGTTVGSLQPIQSKIY